MRLPWPSGAYYPDTRNIGDNATDMFSNIMKEFWPDINRHSAPGIITVGQTFLSGNWQAGMPALLTN
jgi:hypothetical protein